MSIAKPYSDVIHIVDRVSDRWLQVVEQWITPTCFRSIDGNALTFIHVTQQRILPPTMEYFRMKYPIVLSTELINELKDYPDSRVISISPGWNSYYGLVGKLRLTQTTAFQMIMQPGNNNWFERDGFTCFNSRCMVDDGWIGDLATTTQGIEIKGYNYSTLLKRPSRRGYDQNRSYYRSSWRR